MGAGRGAEGAGVHDAIDVDPSSKMTLTVLRLPQLFRGSLTSDNY